MSPAEACADEPVVVEAPRRRRRKPSAAQTIGGVIFGFEQQVWRTAPPPQELVHHARPDAPLPAGDGTMFTIELPRGGGDGEASLPKSELADEPELADDAEGDAR
jgi:hypothetical protein